MKRPSEADGSVKPDGFNKRRRPNKVTGNGADPKLAPEDIQTLRQLQSLFCDFSKPEELNNGIQCFKAFLNRCSKGAEIPDKVADFNLKLLKEWLEIQSKRATDGDAKEGQANAFGDILQVWSYASQKNALSLLSSVVSSLAWVVRICSQNEDLRSSGFVLCKAILQQSYLKIIYRTLVSNREHVVAPCLRMLTEVNRFDHGSACGILFSAFDFTVKDITRNLEVRGGRVETIDDLRRPTIRTTFLRFITSFFQYGSSNIKNQILGLRPWISPMFKYLRTDSPVAISEVVGALSKYIIEDKEIPRVTKTKVFNEWVLGHIAGLYCRRERVTISKAGREEEKSIAEIAHEFLLNVCTTPGNGICFPSSGWYPPGLIEGEEKRRGSGPPKVHNRTLSSFISSIRPYSDTLQQDLLLAIFKACPELVASYFITNTSFSFDPRLTSTWIGYCGFLTAAIELPIPDLFGPAELSSTPPPISVIAENVIPNPLTKAVLTKCISHESSCNLIKFLTTRLLVVSFQKLRRVLSALDEASASMVDPSKNWLRARFEFIEEFCKRVPDMSTVSGLIKSSSGLGMLQREATSRLLVYYCETLPELAFAGSFDVTLALGTLFADEEGPSGQAVDEKGLGFLEIRHLLRVAKDAPDLKWWHKPVMMPFSPFASILRACCGPNSNFPLHQIKTLLHSFVAPSLLFQAETLVSPLEALLESLTVIAQPATFEAALVFLDESVSRCIHAPFKYIDDCAELVLNISESQGRGQGTAAVSPLVVTTTEQFRFFIESNAPHKVKLGVSTWLARLMESCAILGENRYVLAALCNRLVKLCGCDKASKAVFKLLKQGLHGKGEFQLMNSRSHESTSIRDSGGGIDSGEKHSRDLFRGLRTLDTGIIENLLHLYRYGGHDVSLFDIMIICKAVGGILGGGAINENDACASISNLQGLLKALFKRIPGGDELRDRSVAMLVHDSVWVESFLRVLVDPGKLQRYIIFSTGFSQLLCFTFDGFEPVLEPFVKRFEASMLGISQFLADDSASTHGQSISLICEPVILQILPLENLPNLVSPILKGTNAKGLNKLQFDLLRLILERLSTMGKHLPPRLLKDILAQLQGRLPDHESFNKALGQYLLGLPEKSVDVDSFCLNPLVLDLGNDHSAAKAGLACALIRKVDAIQDLVLSSLAETSGSAKVKDISPYLTALLETFSMPVKGAARFEWTANASTEARDQLDQIFGRFQENLYKNYLSSEQVTLLQQAVSLLPSLDKGGALQNIIQDNRRSNLTAKTVDLIDALIDSLINTRETADIRSWVLRALDFLTRIFEEDGLLSEEVLMFTKRLGGLFAQKRIDLSSSAPRATLNAVLESGLQKHIDTPEVVYFVTVMVSQLPPKVLNAGKLLQIVLEHSKNPLLSRRGTPDEISHHMAFVIYCLFSVARLSQSTITTLDGVLGLYRGTNDIIDTAFLNIIWSIEAHLAQSCANRIADWTILERADGKPFISRVRGRLFVVVDSKKLARSVFQYSPRRVTVSNSDLKTFELFMGALTEQKETDSRTYNPEFLLPALTYCLLSDNVIVDVQAATEKHTLGFAIMALCSHNKSLNTRARSYLSTAIAKLEARYHSDFSQLPTSIYREKTQILHLLCAILASSSSYQRLDASQPSHIPTVVGVFLAQLVQVLSSPSHFLYEKVMELLLRQPLLNLHDVPHIISLSNMGEEYHREIFWILNVLEAGLKTEEDLDLYRKRNVFGNCLNVYNSPYTSNKEKEKVVELLWNAAGIEGGGTTLITRNGIISWTEHQLSGALSAEDRILMKRLGARLFESSAKEHISEWSKGDIEYHLRDGILGK
ncbi:unnamed protein product [Tuber aestivum]|uniref:Nucleolar pre-ribosomal-associated protein 1 N-terminal domain-containing protein n=1 Tax=Tuber aestivum TaxID=59557 RepID=A0A292PU34_9PEZI|nr:unnamed protein product [Tuber aestivum]